MNEDYRDIDDLDQEYTLENDPVELEKPEGLEGSGASEEPTEKVTFFKRLKSRPFFRVVLNRWVFMTAVFLFFLIFKPGNNLIRWIKAGLQLKKQEYVMQSYKRDIQDMDRAIKDLTTNKDSLEKYARENYFFREPGEDVFVID